MEHTLEPDIRVVGVAVSTHASNAPTDIGGLWQRAGAGGHLAMDGSPNYSVYFDYESDYTGGYRVLVGRQSDAPLKDGEEEIVIPSGTYLRLQDEGPVPDTTVKLWTQVYETLEEKRGYGIDFERYVGSPTESKVELFLSRK
ncbi:MAG: effector binding domain-containing protein [Myxococcota bacterium]